MVDHSWPSIYKLCLVLLLVVGLTWLRVICLFGLSLYQNSSYIVHLCLIELFCNYHLAIYLFIVLCQSIFSLKSLICVGPFRLAFIFDLWFYFSCFTFRDPVNTTRTDLDVDGSIISHISSAWYIDPSPCYFQYWVNLTLRSANMDRTSVEDVWPRRPRLSWENLITPTTEGRWA